MSADSNPIPNISLTPEHQLLYDFGKLIVSLNQSVEMTNSYIVLCNSILSAYIELLDNCITTRHEEACIRMFRKIYSDLVTLVTSLKLVSED
jgi:hypothetical protein